MVPRLALGLTTNGGMARRRATRLLVCSSSGAPISVPHHSGSLRDAAVIALLFGCACLYGWFFYFRRQRDRSEGQLARSIEALPVTRLVDLSPGGLVAVTGRVVDGLRTKLSPVASPWVPAEPIEVHHHLIIDDGSGRTLRIGRGEVGKFNVGDIVFAVGTLEGAVAEEPYRSVDTHLCLVRGDGLFLVAVGTRDDVLRRFREPQEPRDRTDRVILVLGVALVFFGALGALVASR